MQFWDSPLTDFSQSSLLDSTRSGSVMALPGSVFLKKVKSSTVTLEKGSLCGAAAGDHADPPGPRWSSREKVALCGQRPLRRSCTWRSTGGSPALDRRLSDVLSFCLVWKTPNMTEKTGRGGVDRSHRKKVGRKSHIWYLHVLFFSYLVVIQGKLAEL